MTTEKSIVWRRIDIAGHEFARIFSIDERYFLEGAAILVFEGKFCHLNYRIECDKNWETSTAKVSGFVGERKIDVEISVDAEKHWTLNGEKISEVEGCIDIDLNFSPVTNTLPIRRLNLEIGEKAKVRAAWLKFPSFEFAPLEQFYERKGENSYIYESSNGNFRAEIETDEIGLVTKYGDFWEIEK